MTAARRKVNCVFVEKRCKRWRWKQIGLMSIVGGTCKDSAMKVGWQVGTEEIDNTLKDLGV